MKEPGLWAIALLVCACGARSRSEEPEEQGFDAGCAPPDCERLCDVRPDSPGCPCDAVEPAACYFGPEGTQGVGVCHAGLAVCEGGLWGVCEGSVLPSDETCNEVDDDCDAQIDEGVLLECGTCGPCEDCLCYGAGEGCEDWADGTSVWVEETGEGALVIDSGGLAGAWKIDLRPIDMPEFQSLSIDASVGEGSVIVSLRELGWSGDDPGPWVEIPWEGGEIVPLETGVVGTCDQMGVQIELRPSRTGESPTLRSVRACYVQAWCDV